MLNVIISDDKESLVRAIHKNNDDKSSSLDIIKSNELKNHSEKFIDKIKVDLTPIINRKCEIENTHNPKNVGSYPSDFSNKIMMQKQQKELEI